MMIEIVVEYSDSSPERNSCFVRSSVPMASGSQRFAEKITSILQNIQPSIIIKAALEGLKWELVEKTTTRSKYQTQVNSEYELNRAFSQLLDCLLVSGHTAMQAVGQTPSFRLG